MTWFESRNVSEADVPATTEQLWAVLTSPERLTRLTPLVASIDAEGDRWTWNLKGIDGLGIRAQPSFTEQMDFDRERRIGFRHAPGADGERAEAVGSYTLEPRGGTTHLAIDITLRVDLPLPRFSRRAVERVMSSAMARTGAAFSANLYAELGLAGTPAAPAVPASS